MNINELDATIAQDEEGVVIPVYAKNGDPDLASDGSQTTITVVGSDSERYRRAQDIQTRRMLRTRRAKMEPDDIRANRIELAASAVIAWHGIEADGQPVPCTLESVRLVLKAQYMLEQIEAAVNEHASFLAKSSAT